jgi:hypothetical protein
LAKNPRGCSAAYKGREAALACRPSTVRRGEADSGGGGRTQPSPARGRLCGGDDKQTPPVNRCGAGKWRSGLAAAKWAGKAELGRGQGDRLLRFLAVLKEKKKKNRLLLGY